MLIKLIKELYIIKEFSKIPKQLMEKIIYKFENIN